MQIKRRELSSPQLDLTPMIDVIFQLIVFLVMTSSFANLGEISVSLPSSSTAETAREVPSLVLEKDGGVRIGRHAVADTELAERLRMVLARHSEKSVSVVADREVPLRRLVSAMDAIRLAGGEGVLVLTEQ